MADITSTTTDSNGISRLLSSSVLSLQFVDVSSSEFANPRSSFTGYSADGYYYILGLPAPTYDPFKASWATEAEHSAATSSRNLLDRFPDRLFVVATSAEVVLIDADELTVWMRFTLSSSSVSSPRGPALGGTESTIVSASFSEGLLYVATTMGIRVINFITDVARSITTTSTYYGSGISNRNSATFYSKDEFTLEEPDLAGLFAPDTSSSYTATAAEALLSHIPMVDDWEDVSGNGYSGTSAVSSVGTATPSIESDTPKTFLDADAHSMGFSNSSKSASDWHGAYAYVDQGADFSFPGNRPFSLSLWVKVDSRGDGSWATRPAMPLLTKGLNGATMRAKFSAPADLFEYELFLEASQGALVFRMYNMGLVGEYIDVTAAAIVPLDAWTHVGVRFTAGASNPSSDVKLYIDGTSVSTSAAASTSFSWAAMAETTAPLLIGNSGKDSSSISSGDWFDGNLLHFSSWIADIVSLSATSLLALYSGQKNGAPSSIETPPYLQGNSCLSLDSTVISGTSYCAIGHPDGLTSIKCENKEYPYSLRHPFTDSFDAGDWDIGTTVSALNVVSFTSTIAGQGWEVGDVITVGSNVGKITAVGSNSVSTATDLTAGGGTTAAVVTRSVGTVLAIGRDLYYTHSLAKVARESSDWYDGGGSLISAFSAVTGVVSISEPGAINNLALLGENLYVSTEVGVFFISAGTFEVESQGAELRYSTSTGRGIYPIVNGDQDGGTCVGVDPETGHLLVANTGTSVSSVTEIDISIHQAFQYFDSSSSPSVDSPVVTLATYRNVNGPPDVEVV